MQVAEAVNAFLSELRADGASRATVAEIEFDLKNFAKFASKDVADITSGDISRFLTDRLNVRVSRAHQRRRHGNVLMLFAWLNARGDIASDPTREGE